MATQTPTQRSAAAKRAGAGARPPEREAPRALSLNHGRSIRTPAWERRRGDGMAHPSGMPHTPARVC
jgi:hypothetical protein